MKANSRNELDDDDVEDDPLLGNDAAGVDEHNIVVQSLGTDGVSSETLVTFPPRAKQPTSRLCFSKAHLKALN